MVTSLHAIHVNARQQEPMSSCRQLITTQIVTVLIRLLDPKFHVSPPPLSPLPPLARAFRFRCNHVPRDHFTVEQFRWTRVTWALGTRLLQVEQVASLHDPCALRARFTRASCPSCLSCRQTKHRFPSGCEILAYVPNSSWLYVFCADCGSWKHRMTKMNCCFRAAKICQMISSCTHVCLICNSFET